MERTADTGLAVAVDHHVLSDRHLAAHHVQQINHLGVVAPRRRELGVNRAGGQNHRVGQLILDELFAHLGTQMEFDPVLRAHGLLELDTGPELVVAVRGVAGLVQGSADGLALIVHMDLVPAAGRHVGALQAGRAGADDHDALLVLSRRGVHELRI